MVYVQYGYTGIYGMFIHGIYTVCLHGHSMEHSAAEMTVLLIARQALIQCSGWLILGRGGYEMMETARQFMLIVARCHEFDAMLQIFSTS